MSERSADAPANRASRWAGRTIGHHGWLAVLAAAGLLSAGCYVWLLQLSSSFAYGSDALARPIVSVLILLAAAFAIYLLAIYAARRAKSDWRLISVIAGGAVAFRAILLFSEPIQEVDIYRYIWDGVVVQQGISPYRYAPQQVVTAIAEPSADPSLNRLARICLGDPALFKIVHRVHFAQLPTVYPAVSQAVFAASAASTPDLASVAARLRTMKLWILLFDLGTLFLIARTLSLCRMPLGLCVIYGWCPLVLKEFANSGHFDSIAVFFATLAVALLVESIARFKGQQRNSRDRSRWIHPVVILAALALAAGIGAKLYPIVLAPMFFLVAGRKLGWRATLLPTVICAAFTLILLWPLLPPSLRGPLGGNVKSPTAPTEKVPADHQPPSPKPAPEADEGPSDTAAGMTAFLKRWEMNDWIFMLVIENLKLQRVFPDRPPVWFSVTPDAWRQGVVDWVVGKGWAEPRDAPFLITRTVTSFVFLLIALALAWCASRSDEPAVWFRIAFLTIAWFWLLSPTQNPWYWTWALPLLAFARLRAWMAVSGLVLIYYLRFWLGYHYPDAAVLGTPYNGHAFFDYVVTWFEFAPWFAWLALEWWLGRHRIESVDVDMKSE